MGIDVSVLLPFRDAADTLEEAVGSILDQRGVSLELIAIDDGSSDGGSAVIERSRDDRARVVRTGARGVALALEAGRREARGEWIARMDADDRCAPDRLARQLAAIRARPRVAAMGCRVEAFPDAEVGAGLQRYVRWQNGLVTPEEHRRDLFVEAPLCHPSVVLRPEALAAVGGWRDEPWAEDYALWLRLDAAGWDLAKVPEVLFEWRHRPDRLTFTDPRYSPERMRELRARFLAKKLAAPSVIVWGAGETGRRLARALAAHGVETSRFVDIDPRKVGGIARGAPIVGPEDVRRGQEPVVVAVGARGARDEVRERLVSRGFVDGTDFVCAA